MLLLYTKTHENCQVPNRFGEVIHKVDFPLFFLRDIKLVTFWFFPLHNRALQQWVHSKGKEFAPQEKILSIYSRPLFAKETNTF